MLRVLVSSASAGPRNRAVALAAGLVVANNLGAASKAVPSYQQAPATLAAPATDIDNQARTAPLDAGANELLVVHQHHAHHRTGHDSAAERRRGNAASILQVW